LHSQGLHRFAYSVLHVKTPDFSIVLFQEIIPYLGQSTAAIILRMNLAILNSTKGGVMNRVELSKEQVRQLLNSWEKATSDSIEKKLIEDLFLITETISSFDSGSLNNSPSH
jgi:predicted thioredoxin/glutaredoxin